MSITKLPDGRWFVDVEPIKGKRFRKRFKTKGEVQRFEATVRQEPLKTLPGRQSLRTVVGSPN